MHLVIVIQVYVIYVIHNCIISYVTCKLILTEGICIYVYVTLINKYICRI